MNHLPYGWRGKLGLIYIASAYSMEVEFSNMAPAGVSTHTTRVALSDDPENFTINDLSRLDGDVLQATKLLSQARLNAIAFGCTSGSFVNGVEYDKELVKQMEAVSDGTPCTTTSTAVVEALKHLSIKKVAVATPYSNEVNLLARKYLEDSGFSITNITGLGIMNDYAISDINPKTIYDMAINANTDDADAIFISCTGLSAVPIIEAIEQDLKKPVITSNQATFWHSLKLSNIDSTLHKFGKLFH